MPAVNKEDSNKVTDVFCFGGGGGWGGGEEGIK